MLYPIFSVLQDWNHRRLPDEKRSICYVAIKKMKINNVPVNFADYQTDDTFITAYYSGPENLDIEVF